MSVVHPESFKFKVAVFVLALYLLSELVIGYTFNCLVLVADAYHVMSDLVGFVIQLYVKKSLGSRDRATGRFGFGLGRAEYLADLMNGMVLATLCFSLALESLQRLYSPENITMSPIVMAVGGFGVCWNLTVFRVFGHHDHEHAHEQHSLRRLMTPRAYARHVLQAAMHARDEADWKPTRSLEKTQRWMDHAKQSVRKRKQNGAVAEPATDVHSRYDAWMAHDDSGVFNDQNDHTDHDSNHENHRHSDNAAILRDAAGDLAGNVAVILDALLFLLFGPANKERFSGLVRPTQGIAYVDPVMSIIVIAVIMHHALPLILRTSFALLQGIDSRQTFFLERDLLHRVPHLVGQGIQNLRMWSLRDGTPVVSMKLLVDASSKEEIEAARQAARQVLQSRGCDEHSTIEIVPEQDSHGPEERRASMRRSG